MTASATAGVYQSAAQAGMTAAHGELGPKVGGHWRRPDDVEARPTEIAWTISGDVRRPRRARADEGLLLAFVELTEGPSAAVAHFAKKWGTLKPLDPLPVLPGTTHTESEPLEHWHRSAARVSAVLEVAAAIHDGSRIDPDVWTVFHEYDILTATRSKLHVSFTREATPGVFARESVTMSPRRLLSEIITGWLTRNPPQTSLRWTERPLLSVEPQSMPSAVCFQLALSVSKTTRGLTTCAWCGTPTPVRRRNGSRDFCETCGRPAALRMAQRDKRARQRAGGA